MNKLVKARVVQPETKGYIPHIETTDEYGEIHLVGDDEAKELIRDYQQSIAVLETVLEHYHR